MIKKKRSRCALQCVLGHVREQVCVCLTSSSSSSDSSTFKDTPGSCDSSRSSLIVNDTFEYGAMCAKASLCKS